jgi:hypothetical protein
VVRRIDEAAPARRVMGVTGVGGVVGGCHQLNS